MPIDLRWNCDSGTHLIRWSITESRDELSQRYNQIWGDFANPETHQQGSTHKLAARNLIGSEFPNHELQFSPDGKPLLHPPTANINHSHAGNYAILATHPNRSVGVDVEQLRPQLLRIYPRFCNAKEMEALGPAPDLSTLLLFWCAKEAIYKAVGQKGTDFREHIEMVDWPQDESLSQGELRANLMLKHFEQPCILHFRRWDDYAVVWVALDVATPR
jgi:phosphopantetheinyl transferase